MTRRRRGRSRGATLVETTLFTAFILLMTFGAVQIGLFGFGELASDGASFSDAHAVALGRTATQAQQESKSAFGSKLAFSAPGQVAAPQGNLASIGLSKIGYGPAASNNRHGGMSLLLPMQVVSRSRQTMPALLKTFARTATGAGAVEPQIVEDCPHYCLQSGGLFQGNSTKNYVDYFTKGENTAPYFLGFTFMKTCRSDSGYSSYATGAVDQNTELITPTPWTNCVDATGDHTRWRSIGLAEFLDSGNYPAVVNGTSEPQSQSFNWSNYATFFANWCHVRTYARIALTLSNTPTQPSTTAQQTQFLQDLFANTGQNPREPNNEMAGHIIYAMGYNPNPAPAAGLEKEVGWDATDLDAPLYTSAQFQGNSNPTWNCITVYPPL